MYLVSACLAGVNCRYNGSNSTNEAIQELVREGKAIAICPEIIGGLPIPRACSEIIIDEDGNRKIVSEGGQDFTKEFIEGAQKTLEIAKTIGIEKAILQSRSPSCGYGLIYDGTFYGKLKAGNGLTAELLVENGIEVYTENELEKLSI
ncbi:DUF523 domain-containing protein [Tepidibacter aestuarii]|uniref:DUF523 domain-containing protein n=1 Tax=Tepidibacter aestuarii TaxID=2925782 RepID=UPI0020BE907B|nr:DUF523 domain-containing protein [Tepidibacter aestuarii]CAH2215401.1 Purine-nucleoside phosphorylase [Tepidibacter aestuarii]